MKYSILQQIEEINIPLVLGFEYTVKECTL